MLGVVVMCARMPGRGREGGAPVIGGRGGWRRQEEGGSDCDPDCAGHVAKGNLPVNADQGGRRPTRSDLPQSRVILRTERCGRVKERRGAH